MLAIEFIQAELGFANREDCLKFLKEMGAILSSDESKVDCKSSATIIQAS